MLLLVTAGIIFSPQMNISLAGGLLFINNTQDFSVSSNIIDSIDEYINAGYDISRVINPVIYQRECLTEGHLPLILDINTIESFGMYDTDKDNFLTKTEQNKSNFGDITYKYKTLINETYFYDVPIYKNENYTYNITVCDNKTFPPKCHNETVNGTRQIIDCYKKVESYRYIWKEIKDLLEIKVTKGQKIIVDIIGNFKAGIGERSVDIIPTVKIGDYQKSFSEYAWWNSNWDYYKQITIDSINQVPSTQTNIPILLNFTDADLASHALDNGSDIAFTLIDNSTQLNHEIESFNGTTGALVAWVNITSLPHDSDLKINMYYGNAGASNQ